MSTATPIAAPPPPTSSRLSRLNQRRLANFRRNRRGYWSFWAFWAIFALSLPAEFIANDSDTSACKAEYVLLSVDPSGASYTVKVPSKGTSRTYAVKTE